jgi:hypothetical protein
VAVAAITRRIPGHADHRPITAVLRHTTGDMRMVMLHSDMGEIWQRSRILAGEVTGVKIVSDRMWRDLEQPFEMLDALDEGAIGLIVLQIADVVTRGGILSLRETEGVLQLTATSQAGDGAWLGKLDGRGSVTARAAQKKLPPQYHPGHRIVAAHMDGSVMGQKTIGSAGEAMHRIVLFVGNRFLAQVPTGHASGRAARR